MQQGQTCLPRSGDKGIKGGLCSRPKLGTRCRRGRHENCQINGEEQSQTSTLAGEVGVKHNYHRINPADAPAGRHALEAKGRKGFAAMPPLNKIITTADSEHGSTTMRIAVELHGRDPRLLSSNEQINALRTAANYGREEFIDTVIALLPLELRATACSAWNQLN